MIGTGGHVKYYTNLQREYNEEENNNNMKQASVLAHFLPIHSSKKLFPATLATAKFSTTSTKVPAVKLNPRSVRYSASNECK